MAKRRENKQKQQQQKPHIFYLKFTGLRWWSKPPTKEKKISNYGAQYHTNHSSISYSFVLFVIQVIIIFILTDFFWFSNFGAER